VADTHTVLNHEGRQAIAIDQHDAVGHLFGEFGRVAGKA
jgi:hypothetical protein